MAGSDKVPLVLAINSADELIGLPTSDGDEPNALPRPDQALDNAAAVAAQNDRALAELQGMMGRIRGR